MPLNSLDDRVSTMSSHLSNQHVPLANVPNHDPPHSHTPYTIHLYWFTISRGKTRVKHWQPSLMKGQYCKMQACIAKYHGVIILSLMLFLTFMHSLDITRLNVSQMSTTHEMNTLDKQLHAWTSTHGQHCATSLSEQWGHQNYHIPHHLLSVCKLWITQNGVGTSFFHDRDEVGDALRHAHSNVFHIGMHVAYPT